MPKYKDKISPRNVQRMISYCVYLYSLAILQLNISILTHLCYFISLNYVDPTCTPTTRNLNPLDSTTHN